MNKNIKLIIKGFVIGLGKVMPGVSGAVLAMMLNVYEPTLNSIANLKKDFYSNVKFLTCLGIGIIIAIVFGSNILLFFLNKYYLPTMFLFLGMMISGMIPIAKESKGASLKQKTISFFIILAFFLLSFLETNNNSLLSSNIIVYFLSGILDAFASIVPGISGTVLLMLLGTYSSILGSFANILNFYLLQDNLIILIPFFVGVIVGTYYISKFINYAFKHHRNVTYNCITGFILISIFMLLLKLNISDFNIFQVFLSILFLVIGFVVSYKVNIK